jgi:hypothetical protein
MTIGVLEEHINNKCTIVWYVNDNKISHMDGKVVLHVIEKIEAKFGKMTVTRGKEHVFLDMNIIFHENGTVSIKMKDYMKEAIAELEKTSRDSQRHQPSKIFFLKSMRKVEG